MSIRFPKILSLSATELVITLPLSVVIISIALFSQFLEFLSVSSDNNLTAQNSIKDNIDYTFTYLNELPFTAYLMTVMFWAFFGSIVYIFLWMAINFAIDLKNNLKISHSFVHPKSFHQSELWTSYILKIVFRIASLLLLILGSAYWLTTFMPTVMTVCRFYVLEDFPITTKLITLVSSYLLLVISLHLLAILLRMFFVRARSISG